MINHRILHGIISYTRLYRFFWSMVACCLQPIWTASYHCLLLRKILCNPLTCWRTLMIEQQIYIYIIIYICSCTAFSRNRLNGSQFHALFGRHVPVSSSFKVAHPIPFQPLLLLLTTFLKSISRMLFRTANLCDPWMSWIQFRWFPEIPSRAQCWIPNYMLITKLDV